LDLSGRDGVHGPRAISCRSIMVHAKWALRRRSRGVQLSRISAAVFRTSSGLGIVADAFSQSVAVDLRLRLESVTMVISFL
jgi:hypothetical protein